MGNSMLMNLILSLFRRQDHSFRSSTIYTNTSMSHLRASIDNQVLFLVFRFRQRQGHGVASSLSGGERLLLFPVQLCSKPAGLSHSCSILSEPKLPPPAVHTMANGSSSIPPRPIQDVDPYNPFFTPPAAPPQPPRDASSLAPPMSVDTHMQSGMEVVDPSQSCRNADFSRAPAGGYDRC
ncbi:hypothetical protein JOM56_012371 [Amanita muscaria]